MIDIDKDEIKAVHREKMPRGIDLLHDPQLNKGTAFTHEEREALGLLGLLPTRIFTLEQQAERILENLRRKPDDIEKYIYLIGLQDRNDTLFYRVVLDNLDGIMPIIYTPTVGKACQLYGEIFRRSRGIFITANDRGRVAECLRNWNTDQVRVIVVTDGERILGLGNLGANGMGIPVGKLSLYTACAGVDPRLCLPITIDVGTDNEALLNDSHYMGLQQHRIRGEAYDELIDEFVVAVQDLFPGAIMQLEDFGNRNAFRLLQKYRNTICTFDDDIQGTAAVTLAGLYSALRITGGELADQKILFLGAGEAGIGIGSLIVSAMVGKGLSEDEARRRCWFVDSHGLVVRSRTDLVEHKLPFAHDAEFIPDFLTAVETLRPTAIIGVSGMPGTFTRQIVEAMTRINERPIVFSLSNPTSKSECTAEEAYTWSLGRAIFASGSPFNTVTLDDGRTFIPGQANNAYIFPAVGLGVMLSRARFISDEMFSVAARALANQVAESDLESGRIYPALAKIREVSAVIAAAVAEVAFESGLATVPRPENLIEYVRSQMYQPVYRNYV